MLDAGAREDVPLRTDRHAVLRTDELVLEAPSRTVLLNQDLRAVWGADLREQMIVRSDCQIAAHVVAREPEAPYLAQPRDFELVKSARSGDR